uniref:Uncharacterized protein n=1 Tax=Romanomermis culicivorax TaxID=13658 RepID=A0A915L3M1_ROMCU
MQSFTSFAGLLTIQIFYYYIFVKSFIVMAPITFVNSKRIPKLTGISVASRDTASALHPKRRIDNDSRTFAAIVVVVTREKSAQRAKRRLLVEKTTLEITTEVTNRNRYEKKDEHEMRMRALEQDLILQVQEFEIN